MTQFNKKQSVLELSTLEDIAARYEIRIWKLDDGEFRILVLSRAWVVFHASGDFLSVMMEVEEFSKFTKPKIIH